MTSDITGDVAGQRRRTGRAGWHRRTGVLPLLYLAALVGVALLHPLLPAWEWLLIHLLLLGAATNAIMVWSAHFSAAVLRSAPAESHWGEVSRLVALNIGVLAVVTGGVTGLAWLGVVGATTVFATVMSHLATLAVRLRRALASRFAVTVHYYLAAATALLIGIPIGAVLLVSTADDERLILVHAHVNLLGWIALTVIGTLVTFWPTTLRTRMADNAAAAASTGLRPALAGLALLGVGLALWQPVVAVAGLTLFAAAAIYALWPGFTAARNRPPASFATWSIAAALGWFVVALIRDGWLLLSADEPSVAVAGFDDVLTGLLAGFVGQVLIGALAYLLPMALGGGPAAVRERTARLDRNWSQRVVMANFALAVFQLPVGGYVRILTSMLVLVALGQFLVPALRLLIDRNQAAVGSDQLSRPARREHGAAVGVTIVLVAVLGATIAQRADEPAEPAAASASGRTTTVDLIARDMRFHPDRIVVPYGDRLIITITNADTRRHDLVLANGARTGTIARAATVRLDAGIIGLPLDGWCSLPGHRQAGMVLAVTVTGAPTSDSQFPGADHTSPPNPARIDTHAEPGAAFVAHDATLLPAEPNRTHRITLSIDEVRRAVAPGVSQQLWTFGGSSPGPVLRGRIGDRFEITLVNHGSTEHGVDFHAGALAPDGPMRPIDPGDRLVYRFTATKAGIWMYHCSAHPMLHHIGNGMFGAVIIDPPGLAPVDREYLLVQSELYIGAPDQLGDLTKMLADQPDAVVFNGYAAQYAHRPLAARTGERVRIWVLDAGPNRASSFHVVGTIFDTVFREGRWDLRPDDPGGAQVLSLSPASGGFVETVFGQAGTYPFLSHSMVDAERGARGAIHVID